VVDLAMYEHAIREVLNASTPRRMAVLRPLKVVIENWEEGRTETLEAVNNPEDRSTGTRPGDRRWKRLGGCSMKSSRSM